jgi:putative flavoprotein involved in K+ transport
MHGSIETVVIGGGQAGLAMSHFLRQQGREHVVLERRRTAERWRSERWDRLAFQFPNWSLELPGFKYRGDAPDAFATPQQVVSFIEAYASFIQAPLKTGCDVRELREENGSYYVDTQQGRITARRVVIATGPFQAPSIPSASTRVAPDLHQIHASQYFNPEQLPPGGVLVVGAGSSGCQIAEELNELGRETWLSVSRHKRVPRRYRGKDLLYWSDVLGRFHTPIDTLPDRKLPPPILLTGVHGGHDVDLRRLAQGGVRLLGRFRDGVGTAVAFCDDLEAHLAAGDEAYVQFIEASESYAQAVGIDRFGEIEPDLAFPLDCSPQDSVAILDLKATNIGTIIWCTGYSYDYGWCQLPIFDALGAPVQRRGITRCPNVYFLGLHYMHTMRSGVLFGVGQDAAYLAEHIACEEAIYHRAAR